MSQQDRSNGGARFSHLAIGGSDQDAAYVRSNPDLLCVLFDVDLTAWMKKRNGMQLLRKAVEDVCIFLNAHIALRQDNCCAIYAAGKAKGKLLFSNTPFLSTKRNTQNTAPDANTYQPFQIIDDAVLQGMQDIIESSKDEIRESSNDEIVSHGIVLAMAQALCHINRIGQLTSASTGIAPAAGGVLDESKSHASTASGRGYRSRILVISASPDTSSQYVAMMNCIFGAQRQGVLIDVCKILASKDSVFLQQASHLTKGTYFRLNDVTGLLQTLMSTFLPSPSLREQLRLPSNDDVDFRAACFCHGKVVDVGYVCSVCLSIYCEPPQQRCFTCRAVFPRRTLRRFNEERKILQERSSIDIVTNSTSTGDIEMTND